MSDIEYDQRVAVPGRGLGVAHERRRGGWFSPGRIIAFLAGAVLLVIGAIALLKTGVDSSLNVPETTVFGITQSAAIGLVELVVGLVLIGCSAAEDLRGLIGFIGALAIAAGVIGLASSPQLHQDVGFGNDTAWFFVIWGAVVLLASFLPSSYHARRTVDVDRTVI